jgi:hypothetical protein
MNSLDLSIIVASYNTKDLLRGCLQSIYENTRGISYEITVVDDCSTDGSPNMVQEIFPQARLICNATNLRYVRANNAGLHAARGRYALLLNSDVNVQPGAFETLVHFMDMYPDAAAAGPKLINPDGSVQHCIRCFAGIFPMLLQAINLHKIWPDNPITNQYYNTDFDYNKVQTVEHVGTTSFIIRRSTWETYGMLDERFEQFMGDFAYCRMLGQHNQKIYYVPNAVVLHYGSQSINQSGLKQIRVLHKALRKFYDVYYAPQHNSMMRLLIYGGIWFRQRLKVAEYFLSHDKRVITGPGAPALSRNQTGLKKR